MAPCDDPLSLGRLDEPAAPAVVACLGPCWPPTPPPDLAWLGATWLASARLVLGQLAAAWLAPAWLGAGWLDPKFNEVAVHLTGYNKNNRPYLVDYDQDPMK